MKTSRKIILCVTALVLASGVSSRQAQGQGAMYFAGTGTNYSYALLNGTNLALYIDSFGDLGAPRIINGSPAKPGGTLVGGKPDIGPKGQVIDPNGTYAALYSETSTAAISYPASVEAKTEYISLGNAATLDGFGIRTSTTGAFTPYSSMVPTTITPSGATINSPLTALSNDTYNASLNVQQLVSFNTTGFKNIAQFTVTFTNSSASPIANVQYVRYVDPNQGVTGGAGVGTAQSFGSFVDPSEFAIGSTSSNNLHLALGVQGLGANSLNTAGTTIFAINGSIPEASIFTNTAVTSAAHTGVNYMVLGANGTSATYHDTQLTHTTYTSTDYQGYTTSGGTLDQFMNGANTQTPQFLPNDADTTLVLESPFITVPAHGSTTFTFFYSFDPVAVPEPGVAALFLGSAVSFSSLAWRRRRANKSA